jgi:hypothetical protein
MSLSATSQELLLGFSRLEYLLLGDLRAVLDEADEVRDNRWLLAILDQLVETLPRQFELREEGGYMCELLDRQPFLAGAIDVLHAEHTRIFKLLADLRSRVANSTQAVALADQIKMELRDWMQFLTHHNRRERTLYQTAFNLDVGVGD